MSKQARTSTLLRLLHYVLPYRGRLLLAGAALVIAAAGVLVLGQGLRLVIDRGFADGNPALLDQALLGVLVVVSILAMASALRYYMVTWIGERLAADLRVHVFHHLLTLEPDFFERNGAGEIQSRLTADTTALQSLFGSSVSVAIRNALMFFGALILMFVTSPYLATLVVVGIPLTILPIFWFGRRVRRLSRASQDRVADIGSYAGEALHGIRTVQAFSHEEHDRHRYQARVEEAFATAIARTRQRAWLTGIALLIIFVAVGLILWQGGHDVLAGRMSVGELSAFVFYAVLAAGAVAAMAEVAGEVLRASGAAERLLELLDAQPAIAAPSQATALPEPVRGEVCFSDVVFAYPSRPDQPALRDFNLRLKPGERVALVGPSGGGKSTVLQLLLRFHDPRSGRITFDGVDLRDLDPLALRSHVGLVAQEPVLFTGTAAENIRYGRPTASDEEVIEAARDAYALDFIQRLPRGMDTPLGPGGVQLSGGQRQRIAIARAILRNPSLLLLDEATSALDTESEHMVQQALDRLMAGRTSLVIAHRLSTVTSADRILVLDSGQLVAEGTHEALLRDSLLYRRLANRQFESAGQEIRHAEPAMQ
ncbi:ATP-binding cassette subfamily B protein [Natronocella acetinitrilica]|uniref:ATP-binding cassette subfamily B protein n=1 Tax=Natronocella acetinitrilica TaxID=414046 RepID=A0AAE3G8V2_9GAMM|nr:ABC transporter transmembrane domain-containing protein [Natronocella acetinitrilica]MCP1675942.1 ATP-binding cassette subfamily B protein [Natronocella acetinitrilica]